MPGMSLFGSLGFMSFDIVSDFVLRILELFIS